MIKIHVLSAGGQLDRYSTRLGDITESVTAEIAKHLPLSGVDVTFQYNPAATIPEVGMCGYAPTGHLVQISLDPFNARFDAELEVELRGTLAHELHHCMRWRGPGYGSSLGAALVSEGLARDFETKFRPNLTLPAYHRRLSNPQTDHLLQIAKIARTNTPYNHSEWFYAGSEESGIPPFAGYDLGLTIVRKFIERSGRDSGQLWNEPAESFYEQL